MKRSILAVFLLFVVAAAAADRRQLAVRMADSNGNGWSGAVIGATGPNFRHYLIATCAHGADRGAQVWAIHDGHRQAVPAKAIWHPNPNQIDLALYQIPVTVDVICGNPIPAIPDGPPALGTEGFGWGYTTRGPGGHMQAKAFSGKVSDVAGQYAHLWCRTASGDSGSVIWDRAGQPIGVQWGVGDRGTVFTPLHYAYQALPKQTGIGVGANVGVDWDGCQLFGRRELPRVQVPIGVVRPAAPVEQPVQRPVLAELPVDRGQRQVCVTPAQLESMKAELYDYLREIQQENENESEARAAAITQSVIQEANDIKSLMQLILILRGQDTIEDAVLKQGASVGVNPTARVAAAKQQIELYVNGEKAANRARLPSRQDAIEAIRKARNDVIQAALRN